MQVAIDISKYRRAKQEAYNKAHNIVPQTTKRKLEDELNIEVSSVAKKRAKLGKIPKSERDKIIKELTKKMLEASKKLEFEEAAKIRDEIAKIRKS